jgi:hypothetical protein
MLLPMPEGKTNYNFTLEINGVLVYDPHILIKHVNNFYRELLGTPTTRSLSLSLDFWDGQCKLSSTHLALMDRPF